MDMKLFTTSVLVSLHVQYDGCDSHVLLLLLCVQKKNPDRARLM